MFSSGEPQRKLRIGLVRRGYSPTGGAESYVGRFAASLAAAGHEPVLFCGPEWRHAAWPHGERREVPDGSPMGFAEALRRMPKDDCDRLFSLDRVWNCDVYRAGDGVHQAWLERRAQHEPAWRGALRRIKPKHRQLLRLEKALLGPEGAGKVIVNSKMVGDEIRRCFALPEEKLRLIYNGLPAQRTLPAEVRQDLRGRLSVRPGEIVLLFAGSGWERKGLRFAIDAVNALPPGARLRLVVAGTGRRGRMPRSTRVTYLGGVRNLSEWLEAADLFLLPTLYDPFSNACLEALAAGLPVITSAANGFSEIIQPGAHGEVVENPADIAALAQVIEGWLDPARVVAARPLLRALAAEYSMERNLEETLRVLL